MHTQLDPTLKGQVIQMVWLIFTIIFVVLHLLMPKFQFKVTFVGGGYFRMTGLWLWFAIFTGIGGLLSLL